MAEETTEITEKPPLKPHPTRDWYADIPGHGQRIKNRKVPEPQEKLLEERTRRIWEEIKRNQETKK